MEIYETGNKKPLKPNNIIHIEIHSPWVSTSYRTPSIAACVDTIERKQIFVRLPVRRFSGGESVVVGIKQRERAVLLSCTKSWPLLPFVSWQANKQTEMIVSCDTFSGILLLFASYCRWGGNLMCIDSPLSVGKYVNRCSCFIPISLSRLTISVRSWIDRI